MLKGFSRVSQRTAAGLLIAAPGLLGLAGLAAFGQLGWALALGVGCALLLAAWALAALHFSQLDGLRHRIRSLAENDAQAAAESEATMVGTSLPELETTVAEVSEKVQRREAVLRAKLGSNDAVLSALPDPLILLDSRGRLQRLNTAAEALFGPGREGRDLIDILRHPELVAAAERACRGGPGSQVEFTLPGNVERSFHARLTPLAQPGELAAALTLHELRAIRRAERLRGDFVANASHELRTPLASLVGFIETLRGPARKDQEAQERFLSIMDEQAQRMSRLIEDLLSLSRIELDEHTPPKDRVDLVHVLRSTAGALEIQARKKQMRIQLDLQDPLEVLGNEDELNQLFQNLIDNAVKYGRPKTEVRVTARRGKTPGPTGGGRPVDGVQVMVSDEGEGIAREDLPRLTERFYRVDKARSRALGGTGLGLAIVKHIVNRHRGRLTIESEPGRGSTFSIHLPLAQSGAQSGAQPAAKGSRAEKPAAE